MDQHERNRTAFKGFKIVIQVLVSGKECSPHYMPAFSITIITWSYLLNISAIKFGERSKIYLAS
jgi:hypothetical protein